MNDSSGLEEIDFTKDEYSEFYYEDDICHEFRAAQIIAKERGDKIEFYSTKSNYELFSWKGCTDILIMEADLETDLDNAILDLLKKVEDAKTLGRIGWIFYNQRHIVGMNTPYDTYNRKIASLNVFVTNHDGEPLSNMEILAKYAEKVESVFSKIRKATKNK